MVVKMKINELVKEVNSYFLNLKAIRRDDGVLIISGNDDALLLVPEKATNFMEVHFYIDNQGMYFTKANREKLSALIDEFLETPIKERFPERKYYLCVFPKKEALERRGESEGVWVNHIGSFDDGFRIDYGPKTAFTEETLNTIKESLPFIAPAIDAMKEPVEEKWPN